MPKAARVVLAVYAAVGIVQLIALAIGNELCANITKPLLLPLLIAFVVVNVGIGRDDTVKWLVVGQFFAWLGDLALMSDAPVWFVIGIAMFLVMQICYIVGYFRLGARAGLRRRRWVLIVYPAFWLIANAALWPGLGAMRLPIAVYSAALVTMAMCSVATGNSMGVGGTLFMISDLLIGEGVAYGAFTGSSVLIMLTYIIGQMIIALAWTDRIRLRQPVAIA